MEPTKRELRQQKREIKRAGVKRRRRLGKQALLQNPDEVPALETDFDFGRHSSSQYNGMDRDPTRRRADREPGVVFTKPSGTDRDSSSNTA